MERNEVSVLCKAMSDVNRLKIIEMLTSGEKCGCNLLDELQVTQPTLSHHMKVLSECGLVSARKEGKWQCFSDNRADVTVAFKDYLNAISCCGSSDQADCCCQE